AALAFQLTEQYERAQTTLESLQGRLRAGGEESDLPNALNTLALVKCFSGDLSKAAELADESFELAVQAGSGTQASLARGLRAPATAMLGRVEEARTIAAETFELSGRSGWGSAAFWASVALGVLELSLGNDAAVVAGLAQSIALVEQDGVIDAFRRPYLPDAI